MVTQTPYEDTTKQTDEIITVVPSFASTVQPFFSGKMPLPPSVNMAYKLIVYKGGMRVGSTPALEQFKHDAAIMLSQADHNYSLINAIRDSKVKVPLEVTLRVYMKDQWKRDLDGVVKYAIDAAFARIQLNDNQIVQVQAYKLIDQIEPRVEIDIRCALR